MRPRGQEAAISLPNVEDAIVVHAVHLALHPLVVVQVAQHQIDGEAGSCDVWWVGGFF